MNLYHGTSTCDPTSIYNSEEGFDLRFASQRMWGYAIYFATNSSYSTAYSFNSASGK